MAVIDALLVEFDQEMACTRELLARLPEDAFAWKPHERSYSLGGLATHLAQLPHWGSQILEGDGYDMGASTDRTPEKRTRADVLETFDRHVADVRRGLTTRTDAELSAPWTLRRNGQTLLTMPRLTAIRRFLLHHVIHHRGQLTVYLRLRNVPLPPMYGPTADERP